MTEYKPMGLSKPDYTLMGEARLFAGEYGDAIKGAKTKKEVFRLLWGFIDKQFYESREEYQQAKKSRSKTRIAEAKAYMDFAIMVRAGTVMWEVVDKAWELCGRKARRKTGQHDNF